MAEGGAQDLEGLVVKLEVAIYMSQNPHEEISLMDVELVVVD